MKATESDKTLLQNNLMKAVRNIPKLKVGTKELESSFAITNSSFLDFTDEKYIDGKHPYKMDATIIIENSNGKISERCHIYFYADIKGTEVKIVDDMVIAEKDFIPYGFELDLDTLE